MVKLNKWIFRKQFATLFTENNPTPRIWRPSNYNIPESDLTLTLPIPDTLFFFFLYQKSAFADHFPHDVRLFLGWLN